MQPQAPAQALGAASLAMKDNSTWLLLEIYRWRIPALCRPLAVLAVAKGMAMPKLRRHSDFFLRLLLPYVNVGELFKAARKVAT
jgi:hypothetical protein